jgi:methylmalonyl-CoA/ethylmalonyl-CoA epimerase
MKIDHLGIAVKNLDVANELWEKLLGTPYYKIENVASERVSTAFFAAGEPKIELLESADENSAIAKFIEKRGEGIHHVAFEVDDIYFEMQRLENQGFTLISKEPKLGADNKLVVFFHPKSTGGVLIELCQSIKI